MKKIKNDKKESSVAAEFGGVLDRTQAARRLQISTRHLDRLTKAGELPAFRLGRRVLYDGAKLVAVATSRPEAA